MLGLLLHWTPRSFLNAVANAVPATTGVLIQFPLYGAIAMILTTAAGYGGATLSHRLAEAFVSLTNTNTFPAIMGIYSAILGFLLPSGGGKWVIEAPYVMQAATNLHVHLGWAVQIYNAAEALPNLINPFWDAAPCRHPWGQGARHRRLHLPATLGEWSACAVPAVVFRRHASIHAACFPAVNRP